MIYVDTSVVLAHVLAEDRRPAPALWKEADLVTSRLTEYECWVRLNAYGRTESEGPLLAVTLAFLDVLELEENTCARCRAPFPVPVRTLDALHLAAADFLRSGGFNVRIATYDSRMSSAAVALGFGLWADTSE